MTDLETRETDRKKQYLKRYKKNLALIDRLKEKLDKIDSRLYNVKSPGFSDMPRGGTPITNEDLVTEKEELQERINRLEKKGKNLKSEILDKIDELDDTRYAEILESFFIDCKDLSTIAEENCYTIRHTIRLYSEAIESVSL